MNERTNELVELQLFVLYVMALWLCYEATDMNRVKVLRDERGDVPCIPRMYLLGRLRLLEAFLVGGDDARGGGGDEGVRVDGDWKSKRRRGGGGCCLYFVERRDGRIKVFGEGAIKGCHVAPSEVLWHSHSLFP